MRLVAIFAVLTLTACNSADRAVPKSGEAMSPLPTVSGKSAASFAPLQSVQVKDAIHRALRTGQNQRWQDGPWSGYAVPSLATLANGCRTIRYTIDQQPDAPATTINACDASPPRAPQ